MSLGNSSEIQAIQAQIELYTKKIEHEKINLKLCHERYNNQFELLLKLQNKKRPQKKKNSKPKQRESVTKQPVVVKESYLENPDLLVGEVNKKAYDSEFYNTNINRLLLDNKNLKAQIEGLRKEKVAAKNISDQLTVKISQTEENLRKIRAENSFALEDRRGALSKNLYKF